MKSSSRSKTPLPRREVVDQYDNVFVVASELSRGGQGVVFRTADGDIALKQPINSATGQIEGSAEEFARKIGNIRLLPLPEGIPVTLPLSTLREEPGYVMKLLSGMSPLTAFEPDGTTRKAILAEPKPDWLAKVEDPKMLAEFVHYARTGGLRRRLHVLFRTASALARLHSAGIVYVDLSPNNVFAETGRDGASWFIDADNLRLESRRGTTFLTKGYGAPEVVAGLDSARPRTDCWAFAVLAFRLLALVHPFLGRRVSEPDGEDDWDANPMDAPVVTPEDRAYAGEFPFIDDDTDGSNACAGLFPRQMVLTGELRALFQETFAAGRRWPWRRPPMLLWARAFAEAFDHAVDCPGCGMGYYASGNAACPWCDRPRPPCLRLSTSRWECWRPVPADGELELPHRMFHPFSPRHADDPECAFDWDASSKSLAPAPGSVPPSEPVRVALEEEAP